MKRSLPFILGFSLSALAQEPPTPGSLPVPTVPSPIPARSVANPANARRPDPNAIRVAAGDDLIRPNITVLDAAKLYYEVSHKRIIMSSSVAQSEVAFTLSGPLTNEEVARFLKLSLLTEGLAIIPIPGETDIVRLVPSGPITNVNQVPMAYYTNEYDLPIDDELVTFKMQLKYLKPDDAVRILTSAIGQLSPAGKMTAVTNASSLIVTENSSMIRQMIEIKNSIDVPDVVDEKWVSVTYGDVEEIAERLNEIYNTQGNSNQSTRTTRTNAPPTPNAGRGATSAEDVPLKIIGVRRTSRILLVGRPADLFAAESMIRSFDQPSSGNTRQTFRLRYLRISDFIPIAENAIAVTLGDSQGAGGAGGGGGNQANRNNNNNNNNNNTTGQQGGDGATASINAIDIPTAPESLQVGNTLLVGDNVANTIIVNGPPHHIELIRDLISDLDTESQQVALSAVIGSYALGDDVNFGIDLARAIDQTGSSFLAGGAAQFGNGVIDPASLGNLADILSANGVTGSGVSIYGSINDDFAFFVNALETQTKFKTLERTVLTTRNNRVANLSSGQRIAVPSSTFVGGTTNGSTTNVEFRDVTLELEIQPLINADNKVTLEISLVRDSIGADRTVGELIIPDINTNELTTSVTVVDGSAVVLGGIITTTDRKTKAGLPLLSSVPGIGRLFGRNEDESTESELIIMIQPRILKNQTELSDFGDDYTSITSQGNDVIDAFPPNNRGVLPARGVLEREEQPVKKSYRKIKRKKIGRSAQPGPR